MRRYRWTWLIAAALAAAGAFASPAGAAEAPQALKIGTLYASSGPFALSSESEFAGLKFWVDSANRDGGVFVKAFGKKIPLKLVAYDDQSSTQTATTLYDQLITQDKVDILASDFGSVLTSVAVPLAAEHKRLLFDVSGTGASFFTPDNPYVVLTSLPTSGVWPETLAAFLVERKIGRIAILYASNDFDASQAETLKRLLTEAGVQPVYDNAVPTGTSSYDTLLYSIAARRPDAVIEFGYPNNDTAFLQALSAGGTHFAMVFTIFPGQLLQMIQGNVGPQALAYTYTYPTPPLLRYNKVGYGLGIDAFERDFAHATGKSVNFLTVAGYNAGLVIGKALETAPQFTQIGLRDAVAALSGHLFTLDGAFAIRADGAQIGEKLPVAQFLPKKGGKGNELLVVYPPDLATGSAVYPAPQ